MAGQRSAAFWNGMGYQLLCYAVHPWVIGVAIYRLKWTFLCQTGLYKQKGLKQACIWCHPLSENTFGAGAWGIWLVVRRWSGSDCWLSTDVIFVIIFHKCSLIDRKFRQYFLACLLTSSTYRHAYIEVNTLITESFWLSSNTNLSKHV